MRVCGAILLISGCLLCVSIVWAAVGFMMMSAGLICLLVAENKAKRRRAEAVHPPEDNQRQEPVLLQPPPIVPPTDAAQRSDGRPDPRHLETPSREDTRQQVTSYGSGYDPWIWRSVVTGDPDLAQSVEVLATFGKKYVDQLATAYLAFNEKSYLPILFRMVAARIEKDFGLTLLGASMGYDAAFNSPGFENTQTIRASAVKEDKPEPLAPIDGTNAAAKQPLVDCPAAGTGARSVDIGEARPRTVRPLRSDETDDLADLLNRIS